MSLRATDWTRYYSSKTSVNKFTRNYVQNILINAIKKFCTKHPAIFELGGANSCFFQAIYNEIKPTSAIKL